jgi:hypothetical protein
MQRTERNFSTSKPNSKAAPAALAENFWQVYISSQVLHHLGHAKFLKEIAEQAASQRVAVYCSTTV